ncbi:hypothetical protein K7432_014975 [Basidiobolus ranarum]|uniref:Uncharacterized protein n=1 Tax=Basidiobolus ranarum TaxID=34480 RepID=A0ABR2VPJ6_9FUNG
MHHLNFFFGLSLALVATIQGLPSDSDCSYTKDGELVCHHVRSYQTTHSLKHPNCVKVGKGIVKCVSEVDLPATAEKMSEFERTRGNVEY